MKHNDLITTEELIEITGFIKPSCQCRALTKTGFSYHTGKDGRPKLTWRHYNAVLNGTKNLQEHQVAEDEPNFEAI